MSIPIGHHALDNLPATLGFALRRARERVGLTPAEIAGLVHVSPADYERFEHGEELPRLQTFCLLSVVLGTSMDELLGLSGMVPSAEESAKRPRPDDDER